MTEEAAAPAPDPAHKGLLSPSRRAKILLVGAATLGFATLWWTGNLFHIPQDRDFSASLLQQPLPLLVILVVILGMTAATVVGTALAGIIRFNAGLFASAAGLLALSVRGGPSRYVLFQAQANSAQAAATPVATGGVYWLMLLETLLLFIGVGALWLAVWRLHDKGWLKGRDPDAEASMDTETDEARTPAKTGFRPGAVVVQVLVTTTFILLLCPTDAKLQALAAVCLASYFGAAVVEYAYESAHMARWYWLGPLLTAIIGYAFVAISSGGSQIGLPTDKPLAPLARPLPLDYAGVGAMGALLGHWAGKGLVRAVVELGVGLWQMVGGGAKE